LTISYSRLFKLLVERGIKKMELKDATGIGTSTLAKLSRNQPVAIEVLVKICSVLNCNIGDIMDVVPDKMDAIKDIYIKILRDELIPAVGCTEPSAIAFVAAKAAQALGAFPEAAVIEVSGSVVKNAKSVVVPNTGGLKGIRPAVAAGFVLGHPERELEVLSDISGEQIAQIAEYAASRSIDVRLSGSGSDLYISVTALAGEDTARVVVEDGHTRVILIEKNGDILYKSDATADAESIAQYHSLNIEDIVRFADMADLEQLRPVLTRQIEYNYAISLEGLNNDWGANVGKSMLTAFGGDIKIRAAAAAAAGSDARMSGCDMPVIILSGSGNQGIAASVPVIVYARELNCPEDLLHRALIVANLSAIHQKTGIGKLSAFCGAVSACCGAAAGVAYLLGGDYEAIAHTIVNTLASVSGIVCDGAKPSCAAKIGMAFMAGILGFTMFADENRQFYGGDGIVAKGVDNTISNVGRMASRGMRETDREILRIMTDSVSTAN
jgi:L-cysteine desulfidase/DNA-binding Xre family transcriptional regulator